MARILTASRLEDVEAHVFECLLDLGFTATQAAALVDARVDWHDAEKLIQAGCTPDLAVRILF